MKNCLAVALIVAFAAPAMAEPWAAGDKTPIGPKQRHVGSTAEHQLKSQKARRRSGLGEVRDPYWTPCDYTSTWGENPCGGGG
jgi:hypothetical protein